MSLLNKASLIQIPSGYKDGTLYSAKPTNGDGDFTFSRGSNLAATRVNSDGLIEKGRENLLLQSNQFDTTWTEAGSSGILTSGFEGYDGSNDAWQLEHQGSQYTSIRQTLSTSGVQTYSVYAKAGTLDYIIIYASSGVSPKAWFNLSTGTIGTQQGGLIDAKIESVGNGWYRCSIVFNDTLNGVRIYPNDANGTFGTTAGNIYIQDAQLEQSLVSTPYIQTTTTTEQAGILEDMPRLDYSGGSCPSLLLEPQRSNLFEYSEYFGTSNWTKQNVTLNTNDAQSPEGVQNASKIYPSSSGNGRYIYNPTSGASSIYTISAYVKADGKNVAYLYIDGFASVGVVYFDLSDQSIQEVDGSSNTVTGKIESVGNGWYRISATIGTAQSISSSSGLGVSDAKGSLSVTKSGEDGILVYGLQIESGSYPTSYIPTYGSSVTRSADDCTDAGNSSLFNDSEGVLFVEIAKLDISATEGGVRLSKDTNNEIRLNFATSNRLNLFVNVGGSNQVYMDNSSYDLEDYHKIAIKYKLNDYAVYVDGTKIHTDTSATVPTGLDELYFNTFYGKVKSVKVFNTALTDAECIDLTTI